MATRVKTTKYQNELLLTLLRYERHYNLSSTRSFSTDFIIEDVYYNEDKVKDLGLTHYEDLDTGSYSTVQRRVRDNMRKLSNHGFVKITKETDYVRYASYTPITSNMYRLTAKGRKYAEKVEGEQAGPHLLVKMKLVSKVPYSRLTGAVDDGTLEASLKAAMKAANLDIDSLDHIQHGSRW